MSSPFCTIDEALDDLRAGRMIVLADDEDRENEGDLVVAAEKVTPEIINFMLKQGRGVLCLPLTRKRCELLNLPLQTGENTTQYGTAFTVTIDAHPRFGVTTGVSASDRSTTLLRTIADDATPSDFTRPGHINPLMARDGGVLVRAGQTEGAVDLCRLAGLKPAGVLIEIMNDDGTMARLPDLTTFCKSHGLRMCTIADLVEYRIQRERFVERGEEIKLPSKFGDFTLIEYGTPVDPEPHLALVCGGIGQVDEHGGAVIHEEPVLVRVESECFTGHVLGSLRCDCGSQLQTAMQQIQEAGVGVLLYLRQEGRGIGLHNKLKAYKLQDEGLDTVEANRRLGLPVDRRDYGVGAHIIRDLGLRSLRILTNNPKKVNRLEVYGITIDEQLPIEITPNQYNSYYLKTKKDKMGHILRDV
ncbi:MAG: 3,4-dihydroxy-2-butanone-4-phosphate synthase [Planctomycetota bacterium]|nr:3,4-dihydroxy-2-butanone-4-phosphate synthase [Planctomycetota bacterium]